MCGLCPCVHLSAGSAREMVEVIRGMVETYYTKAMDIRRTRSYETDPWVHEFDGDKANLDNCCCECHTYCDMCEGWCDEESYFNCPNFEEDHEPDGCFECCQNHLTRPFHRYSTCMCVCAVCAWVYVHRLFLQPLLKISMLISQGGIYFTKRKNLWHLISALLLCVLAHLFHMYFKYDCIECSLCACLLGVSSLTPLKNLASSTGQEVHDAIVAGKYEEALYKMTVFCSCAFHPDFWSIERDM